MAELSPEEWVAAGRVLRPHGLSGEAVVEVWTDFPERFSAGRRLYARSGKELIPLTIESARPHQRHLLVKFAELLDPEGVGRLRNLDLCVSPEDRVEKPQGYFFHHELRGMRVVDLSGNELGIVSDLEEGGAGNLLVVRTPRGSRDIPFTAPIVVSVDLAAKTIVLDPPSGLLD
jgi:16S rRNA processing protein RimM